MLSLLWNKVRIAVIGLTYKSIDLHETTSTTTAAVIWKIVKEI